MASPSAYGVQYSLTRKPVFKARNFCIEYVAAPGSLGNHLSWALRDWQDFCMKSIAILWSVEEKYREILDIFAISEEESTSIEIQHSKLLDEIDYMKKHSKIYPLNQESNSCFERTYTLLNFMDR